MREVKKICYYGRVGKTKHKGNAEYNIVQYWNQTFKTQVFTNDLMK